MIGPGIVPDPGIDRVPVARNPDVVDPHQRRQGNVPQPATVSASFAMRVGMVNPQPVPRQAVDVAQIPPPRGRR